MEQELTRRNILKIAIGAAILGILPSCASVNSKPGPILIDSTNIKDLNDFIAAIKKAGAGYLPKTLTLEDYYRATAKSFIENARKAAELGMSVPQWIFDKLPNSKLAINKNNAQPVLITLAIVGLIILVPLSIFFIVAFSSILTLTRYINEKLNEKYM